MRLEVWSGGVFLGTTVRSGPGTVYAYTADGAPLGTFSDSAAAALARLLPVAA